MSFFRRIGFIGTVGVVWASSAFAFFGACIFPPLVLVALPLYLPSLLIGLDDLVGLDLGDEAQERYGIWGEAFYSWLLSFPWVLLCALVIYWWSRRKTPLLKSSRVTE